MTIPAHRKNERGSLLVAVLAVIMLFGATYLAANVLSADGTAPDDARIQTKSEMERIADQITAFVHMYNRMPCPALPATNPAAATFGKEVYTPAAGCSSNVGLVPWRSLGLADNFAIDAWQDYYTYAVSPVFANVEGTFNPETQIFEDCRTSDWIISTGQVAPNPTQLNVNRIKSRFCCPGGGTPVSINAATDLTVFNAAGQIDPNDATAAMTRSTGTQTAGIHVLDSSPLPAGTASSEGFAYVLVSHGNNGRDHGSYRVNGTNARYTLAAGVPPATEAENADNDITYRDGPLNFSDVGYATAPTSPYFDDIILFRTNFGVYSELGQTSCRLPY